MDVLEDDDRLGGRRLRRSFRRLLGAGQFEIPARTELGVGFEPHTRSTDAHIPHTDRTGNQRPQIDRSLEAIDLDHRRLGAPLRVGQRYVLGDDARGEGDPRLELTRDGQLAPESLTYRLLDRAAVSPQIREGQVKHHGQDRQKGEPENREQYPASHATASSFLHGTCRWTDYSRARAESAGQPPAEGLYTRDLGGGPSCAPPRPR